jgi:hypothetical protein
MVHLNLALVDLAAGDHFANDPVSTEVAVANVEVDTLVKVI